MKSFWLLSIIAVFLSSSGLTHAQQNLKSVNLKPKAGIKLKLLSEDGRNGSAVAWVDEFEKYYTLIAGNADYPLEVFDDKGNNIQSIPAGADFRGLWYNPEYSFLEGNTYDYHDILSFGTDEKGLLTDEIPYEELYELPVYNPQSVLNMDTEQNMYIWLENESGEIIFIDAETGEEGEALSIEIPTGFENINSTTVVYTGINGGEYALLNYVDKLIYLIDGTTGKESATIKLPSDAVTNQAFCFSFANGQFWLFDIEKREWQGYKVY
jgi:hypothetical protein